MTSLNGTPIGLADVNASAEIRTRTDARSSSKPSSQHHCAGPSQHQSAPLRGIL